MKPPDYPQPERRAFSPWRRSSGPRSILLIRLHALGDVALTLPAAQGLRDRFPAAQIDMLTSAANAPLLRSVTLFDDVPELTAAEHPAGRIARALRAGMSMRTRKYDVVIDLQRNRATRILRRVAAPASWGEFDRFGPRPASERVLETIVAAGFAGIAPSFALEVRPPLQARAAQLLRDCGRDPQKRLIVLNPAGLWETRNWPLENYISLARLWREQEDVQFLIVGTERIQDKAARITARLGDGVIDLVGKSPLEIVLPLLQNASVMITEDSGLMHAAWALGIPIVALFGSSRHVWSAPTGPKARALHSGDLQCGQCMEPFCAYGDVHCLTRHAPAGVLEIALELTSHTTTVAR